MAAEITSADLFDRLVADSRDAVRHLYFKSAYHALAGAMHCAEQDFDVARLRLVGAMIQEQRIEVDAAAAAGPGRDTAGMVGPTGFYQTLHRQLGATIRLVELRGSIEQRATSELL